MIAQKQLHLIDLLVVTSLVTVMTPFLPRSLFGFVGNGQNLSGVSGMDT